MKFKHYETQTIELPFKFVSSMSPIDDFSFTLTKVQLVENLGDDVWGKDGYGVNGFDNIDDLESYISEFVEKSEGIKPHTVRYTSIPKANGCDLVVIAKVSKGGICYVFANNEKFLKSLDV